MDGTIKLDEYGYFVLEDVSDIYEWNQKHRNQHKAGSGFWRVSEQVEGGIFLLSADSGVKPGDKIS